jgi:hypothetical protein
MGMSTKGVLAYGYHLGGGDSGWDVREAGEYGELNLDWHGEEAEDDFAAAAEARLLAEIAGFTEQWGDNPDGEYWTRHKAAKARLGVELETYCQSDYPTYVLAAKVITAHGGDVEVLDLGALATVPPEWNERLAAAVAALGITPTQERPGWVLGSYRG